MISQNAGLARLRIDGNDLHQMLALGAALLQENVEQVNALNVFPVPDGDTGTNMLLTVQSCLEEVQKVAGDHFGVTAQAAAHGSLMGARGNSGVILSQILRGIARASEGHSSIDAQQFARALQEGVNTAYRGVGKPVEGTILTVARESAEAAMDASKKGCSIEELMRRTVESGQRSVESTPDLLPVLKEAGVVDAGGQGYLLILEGARQFVAGERISQSRIAVPFVNNDRDRRIETAQAVDYGYCTELLLRGERLQAEEMRRKLEELGTSVLAVGEDDLLHLHLHTHRPGDVLNFACAIGSLEKIKIENMKLQHSSFLVSRDAPGRPAGRIAVVAVAPAAGLASLFQDLGAAAIVHGGQAVNPSIAELVASAESTGSATVILLPNNANVVATAQQARALTMIDLRVVPTKSVCEGIAALVAFNADSDAEINIKAMEDAARKVRTIEITRAVRSTRLNGLQVREGQPIGILDGALVESAASMAEVTLRTLDQAEAGAREVLTIYCGEGVLPDEVEALREAIQGRWPDLEVQTVSGGQPHYPFIISVE